MKKIRANYAELANLPINSILGNLYTKKVITMQEKKYIGTLGLETKKMEHLLDNIIIPSLNNKLPVKFEGFLEVMKKSEDSIFTNMAKKLGMWVSKIVMHYQTDVQYVIVIQCTVVNFCGSHS